MDPAAPIIKELTHEIEAQMKQVSDNLYNKYRTILERIETKRFDTFKSCLKEKPDIAECYEKSDKYQISIDFAKGSRDFQQCIEAVTNDCMDEKIKKDNQFMHKKVDNCAVKYQNFIASEMEKEIKRLQKFL